jgi:hypothetical protein
MSSLIPSVSLRPRRAEADKINQHGVRGMFVQVVDNGVVIGDGYAAAFNEPLETQDAKISSLCASLRGMNRHIADACFYIAANDGVDYDLYDFSDTP